MTSPVREAVERRDVDALAALFSDDIVFRSPVTAVPFVGREAAGELMRAVIASFEEVEYLHELREDDVEVLVGRARIAGRDVHVVDVIHYDGAGRIAEFVVYGRPMAGVALFASEVGPVLAGRRGRLRRLAASLLARPLPGALARGDRAMMRLVVPGR